MKIRVRGNVIAIQLMLLSIFVIEAREKWMTGGAPEWFTRQFANTWLAGLPGGLDFSWYLIAVVETLIALATTVSIGRGEFLGRPRRQGALKAALMTSLLLFVMLGFGGRLSGNHDIAAHSFMYFTGTLLSLTTLERSRGWNHRHQNQRRDSQKHQPRFVKNR